MTGAPTATSAGALLARFAELITVREWAGLRALLADDAEVHYAHTGERFGPDAFVALLRDYPGDWSYHADEVVDGGARAVLHSHTVVGDQVSHCATFAGLHGDRLTDVVEIWAEPTAPHPDRSTP